MLDQHPEPSPAATPTPGRQRPANRRSCVGFSFELGGQKFHATYGLFEDGTPSEFFINGAKADSAADIMARDSAVAVSIALQFGCPVNVLRKALMRDSRGSPSGLAAFVLDLITADMEGAT
jgi:ribonucleoside-diphosphate reductase alpha chain